MRQMMARGARGKPRPGEGAVLARSKKEETGVRVVGEIRERRRDPTLKAKLVGCADELGNTGLQLDPRSYLFISPEALWHPGLGTTLLPPPKGPNAHRSWKPHY